MNILICGLGSMGKRRIRLLKKLYPTARIVGIDSSEIRRNEVNKQFSIECFNSNYIEQNLCQPDVAFICTPPLTHFELSSFFLKKHIPVFSEINLVQNGYEELHQLSLQNDTLYFLSSTPLFRDEICNIQNLIKEKPSNINYTYHVGQYLPDWHPWESYQSFFVGDSRTNGCREIMAIEMPWIYKTFGHIVHCDVLKTNVSSLSISYPDSYFIIMQHENNNQGVFCVDVVSRKAIRSLEIYSEQLHIFWQGTPDSLSYWHMPDNRMVALKPDKKIDSLQQYSDTIIENAYLEEIKVFFSCLEHGSQTPYTLSEDKIILDWIDRIEERIQ